MGRRQGGESNENGGRVLDGVCLGGPAGGGGGEGFRCKGV